MATKEQVLDALADHIGRANGISSVKLAAKLGIKDRALRALVTELRYDDVALCGYPGAGYYLAATREDLTETLDFLKHRALHSLKLASVLRKKPLAELVGQLPLTA